MSIMSRLSLGALLVASTCNATIVHKGTLHYMQGWCSASNTWATVAKMSQFGTVDAGTAGAFTGAGTNSAAGAAGGVDAYCGSDVASKGALAAPAAAQKSGLVGSNLIKTPASATTIIKGVAQTGVLSLDNALYCSYPGATVTGAVALTVDFTSKMPKGATVAAALPGSKKAMRFGLAVTGDSTGKNSRAGHASGAVQSGDGKAGTTGGQVMADSFCAALHGATATFQGTYQAWTMAGVNTAAALMAANTTGNNISAQGIKGMFCPEASQLVVRLKTKGSFHASYGSWHAASTLCVQLQSAITTWATATLACNSPVVATATPRSVDVLISFVDNAALLTGLANLLQYNIPADKLWAIDSLEHIRIDAISPLTDGMAGMVHGTDKAAAVSLEGVTTVRHCDTVRLNGLGGINQTDGLFHTDSLFFDYLDSVSFAVENHGTVKKPVANGIPSTPASTCTGVAVALAGALGKFVGCNASASVGTLEVFFLQASQNVASQESGYRFTGYPLMTVGSTHTAPGCLSNATNQACLKGTNFASATPRSTAHAGTSGLDFELATSAQAAAGTLPATAAQLVVSSRTYATAVHSVNSLILKNGGVNTNTGITLAAGVNVNVPVLTPVSFCSNACHGLHHRAGSTIKRVDAHVKLKTLPITWTATTTAAAEPKPKWAASFGIAGDAAYNPPATRGTTKSSTTMHPCLTFKTAAASLAGFAGCKVVSSGTPAAALSGSLSLAFCQNDIEPWCTGTTDRIYKALKAAMWSSNASGVAGVMFHPHTSALFTATFAVTLKDGKIGTKAEKASHGAFWEVDTLCSQVKASLVKGVYCQKAVGGDLTLGWWTPKDMDDEIPKLQAFLEYAPKAGKPSSFTPKTFANCSAAGLGCSGSGTARPFHVLPIKATPWQKIKQAAAGADCKVDATTGTAAWCNTSKVIATGTAAAGAIALAPGKGVGLANSACIAVSNAMFASLAPSYCDYVASAAGVVKVSLTDGRGCLGIASCVPATGAACTPAENDAFMKTRHDLTAKACTPRGVESLSGLATSATALRLGMVAPISVGEAVILGAGTPKFGVESTYFEKAAPFPRVIFTWVASATAPKAGNAASASGSMALADSPCKLAGAVDTGRLAVACVNSTADPKQMQILVKDTGSVPKLIQEFAKKKWDVGVDYVRPLSHYALDSASPPQQVTSAAYFPEVYFNAGGMGGFKSGTKREFHKVQTRKGQIVTTKAAVADTQGPCEMLTTGFLYTTVLGVSSQQVLWCEDPVVAGGTATAVFLDLKVITAVKSGMTDVFKHKWGVTMETGWTGRVTVFAPSKDSLFLAEYETKAVGTTAAPKRRSLSAQLGAGVPATAYGDPGTASSICMFIKSTAQAVGCVSDKTAVSLWYVTSKDRKTATRALGKLAKSSINGTAGSNVLEYLKLKSVRDQTPNPAAPTTAQNSYSLGLSLTKPVGSRRSLVAATTGWASANHRMDTAGSACAVVASAGQTMTYCHNEASPTGTVTAEMIFIEPADAAADVAQVKATDALVALPKGQGATYVTTAYALVLATGAKGTAESKGDFKTASSACNETKAKSATGALLCTSTDALLTLTYPDAVEATKGGQAMSEFTTGTLFASATLSPASGTTVTITVSAAAKDIAANATGKWNQTGFCGDVAKLRSAALEADGSSDAAKLIRCDIASLISGAVGGKIILAYATSEYADKAGVAVANALSAGAAANMKLTQWITTASVAAATTAGPATGDTTTKKPTGGAASAWRAGVFGVAVAWIAALA